MFFTIKFSKKIAVSVVLAVALLFIALIFIFSGSESAEALGKKKITDLDSRLDYLSSLEIEVDPETESYQKILIPQEFSGVFMEYNKLQKSQGFDLEKLAGIEVDMYTYVVTNFDSKETVIAVIFVHNSEVVGGDIHSTTLNGFMQGIKK